MHVFTALGINDLRSIRRDSLLLYMFILPWLLVVLLRFLVPDLTRWLAENYNLGLEPYYPLILSFFLILQIPMVFGVIIGLLMLDERDEGTLVALRVTPVSPLSYVHYRISVVIMLSVLFILISLPLSGLMPLTVLPAAVPIAVVSGLFSMVLTVVLATFSNNKVEGLALMKGFGILMLGPLAAYFIDSNRQLLMGIFPSYWAAKAFWVASAGESSWPYVAAGLAYNLLLLYWMLRLFNARLNRQ